MLNWDTTIGQMLVSMDTCYNCEPMLFTRYVFMKNKVIGEKNEFRKKMQLQPYCAEPTIYDSTCLNDRDEMTRMPMI